MNPRKARREGKKYEVVKSNNSLPLLQKQIKELEERVAELEQRVFAMNRLQLPEAPKPKPGPKPRLSRTELLRRRDALIYWLEDNWPELRIAIRRAPKPEHLINPLRRAQWKDTYLEEPPFHLEWNKYWPLLWKFVQSRRYHNNPRNIANAMAGIPELGWKRSFDICTSHPSQLEVQPRAVLDYLQRKVPERLKAIRVANGNAEEIRSILGKRTTDRQLIILSQRAKQIPQYLKEGQAT